MSSLSNQRNDALTIWRSSVCAVKPLDLLHAFVQSHPEFIEQIKSASRILVVGAGKASGSMASAFEEIFSQELDRIEGIVNVPDDAVRDLKKIQLHSARPKASNHPTAQGVVGSEKMLELFQRAQPNDLGIALISGGGSALLPAPDEGISLEDKQAITKQLHACGATIQEMNCVRKHLSRIKGGRLAQAFRGKQLFSLIISDVIGDPLNVIGSGPTSLDTTTFADALAVLDRYQLRSKTPPAIVSHFLRGTKGEIPETLKTIPQNVRNIILGNNQRGLQAATEEATKRDYCVLNLGSFIEGETNQVAIAIAGLVQSIRHDRLPISAKCCLLIGGETTVTLNEKPGKGGRNQEFVLSMMNKLGLEGMKNVTILSGGTDGEDGPTDAAGAIADSSSWDLITQKNLNIESYLRQHDAYSLFDQIDGLIRTGLTQTNVMDVRVILIG
jgi:glycerate 2-kinase